MVAAARRAVLVALLLALVVPTTWAALGQLPRAFALTGDPVLVAAGDIACDPANPYAAGTTSTNCQARTTADTIAGLAPQYVLPLGDTQYSDSASQGDQPTLTQYSNGYGQSWGRLGSRLPSATIRPVAGNHEYGDMSETSSPPLSNASNFFSYFGPSGLNELPAGVTSNASAWYSYDIPVNGGSWHVVALDAECAALPAGGAANGCATGSPQETWLAQDLAAHQGACTLAYWHQPRWASGDNNPSYSAMWADLVRYHATLTLHGHEHIYQRFSPLDADGLSSSTGVAEIIAGTGGVNHEPAGSGPGPAVPAYTDETHFGVVSLTLHSGSVDYAFVGTDGTRRDPGTLSCATSPTPSPTSAPGAPTVTALNPVSGPSAGGTTVTVTGTGFDSSTQVKFGSTAASSVSVTSATSLTAVAPAGTSTVHVTATTSKGTSATSAGDLWTPTFATNGWTTTLSATSSTAAVGASITLTATTNKDTGPTPYFLCVYDVTSGTPVQIKRQGSGTSASVTVTASSASVHRYVAQVDDGTSAGTNAQADSSPVIVTWGNPSSPSPSPSPTTSPSPTATGATVPPATTAPVVSSLSPISGPWSGGTAVQLTGSGFDSSTQVSFGTTRASAVTLLSPTSLTATAPAGSATVHVTATNSVGTSGTSVNDLWTPTFSNNGWSVTLSSTATSAAIGGSVTLTTTANKDPGPTPYFLCIYDVSSGTPVQVLRQGQGTTASLTVSSAVAATRRYVAQVDDGTSAGSNTQAVATPVVLTWGSPTSSPSPTFSPSPSPTFSPSPSPTFSPSPSPTFSPSPSPTFSPTPSPTDSAPAAVAPTVSGINPWYGPSTGGTTVTVSGSGFTSSGSTVTFGSTRATGVTVTSPTTLTVTAPTGTALADVRVTTANGTSALTPADRWSPTAALNGYSATLTASATTALAGRSVTLTATSNKALGRTPYYLCIVDVETGALLLRSGSGGTVQLTVTSSTAAAHRYVARIDDGNGGAGGQVQAASTPLRISWT